MAIISFTKVYLHYGWLENMAPYPVEYEGKLWRTSEALFQALRFEDELIRELIREQKSPMSAKMKAKAYKDQLSVIPMSDQDVDNMRICLNLKFTQHSELKEKLLRTNLHTIVENIENRKGARHQFWGAYKNHNNEWVGTNTMGNLLMELRNALSEIA